MKKRLKINGIIMVVAAIIVAVFPKFFLRSYSGDMLEEMIETLGFAFILLGQIIRVSARGYKAENSQDSRALIQGGPYQIVRNPMYLGIFLIGLGVVLAIFRWWAAGIFVVVFIIRYILLIYKEEKNLSLVFPGEYSGYCRKTPRIFPSFSSMIKLDIVEYLPIKMVWFKKEIGSIFTLLFLALFIESWEDIAREGVKIYLLKSGWLFLTFVLFYLLVIFLSRRTEKYGADNAVKNQGSL